MYSDDEILLMAAKIKARRALEKRRDSFKDCKGLMIRWSNPSIGYTSIEVTKEEVGHIVSSYFNSALSSAG